MTETQAAAAEDIRIDLAGLPTRRARRMAPDDDADPPLRGAGRAARLARRDPRRHPLGRRPGGRGRRHDARAAPLDPVAGTHRSHHTPSPRACRPAVMAELYGRATGVGGRPRRHDAPRRPRAAATSAATASSARASASPWAPRWPASSGRGASPSASSATAASTSAAPGRRRTWPSIWELPLVIVCENNMYAVETRFDLVLGGGSAVRRGRGLRARAR